MRNNERFPHIKFQLFPNQYLTFKLLNLYLPFPIYLCKKKCREQTWGKETLLNFP